MTAPDATFADKPTLTGDLVTLRPGEPAEIPVMVGILTDPEVLRLTGSAHSRAEIEHEKPDLTRPHPHWAGRTRPRAGQ